MLRRLRSIRWQYSLRALVVSMGLVSIGAAAYGSYVQSYYRQERAFEKISARGGSILVYGDGMRTQTHVVIGESGHGFCGTGLVRWVEANTNPVPFTDADIEILDGIHNLASVSFSGSKLSQKTVDEFTRTHPDCHVRDFRDL